MWSENPDCVVQLSETQRQSGASRNLCLTFFFWRIETEKVQVGGRWKEPYHKLSVTGIPGHPHRCTCTDTAPPCKLSAVVFSQLDNSLGGRPAVGNKSHLKCMVVVLSQYFDTLSPKHGQQYSQGVSHSSLMMMMMMMNWRIMRLIVQMFLQVERGHAPQLKATPHAPLPPPPPLSCSILTSKCQVISLAGAFHG